jgi:HAD superfamily hydrolase (TIGR01509 family)
MKYKGVIFDFNGTLFWDTELHDRAWDTFLKSHDIILTLEEKDQKIHGKNNRDILKGVFDRELPDGEIEDLSLEKEDIYQDLCLKGNMELAPGAVDFFQFLEEAGVSFTIATAANRYNVDFYFKQLDLGAYFDPYGIVCDDGSMMSKPNPEIFIRAMQQIEVSPEDILIFEDSVSGVAAAENSHASGIIVVESVPGRHGKWPYQVIRDFSEVDRSIF